jgi:hypothetical protein
MTRELVVSYLINMPTGDPFGHRVWSDGQTEGYRVREYKAQPDGSLVQEAVTPGWVPLVKLTHAQVESFRHLVSASGLLKLGAVVDAAGTRATNSGTAEWQASDSKGVVKTVKISRWPAGDQFQGLQKLVSEIGKTILDTQNAN